MDEYEIYIRGDIGWDVTPESFNQELLNASGKDLLIKVSSDGGNVDTATVIRNSIVNYAKKNNAKVTIEIEGWAQSSASYIATVSNAYVKVYKDSLFMIHNPSTVLWGDYKEFEKQATFLKSLTEVYAVGYSERSKKDKEEVLQLMQDTTYYIGQEIIDAGFADELIESNISTDTNMKNKNDRIRMGAEKFIKTTDRLKAVALGHKDKKEETNKKDLVMEIVDTKDKITMTDKKEDKQTVAVDDKERAVACMKAQSVMPDQHENLRQKFEAGMSADYFTGMVAHVEMLKAKEDLNNAKEENPSVIMPKEPKFNMSNKKTDGESGKTIEV